MLQVLSKLLVGKFYKLNAGFFLFLFIILFGILPGAETIQLHKGLMLAAVSSWSGLLVAAVISTLYGFKCVLFAVRELSLPENSFIYNMQGMNNNRQHISLVMVFVSLFSPVLTYGIIAVFVGLRAGQIGAVGIIGILLTAIVFGSLVLFRSINSTWKQPLLRIPQYRLLPQKHFFSYLLFFSVDSKKGAFISIKIFSLLALQFMVALNTDKVSKENICFLILLSIAAHALLPLYYVRFIETGMPFLRNMPLRLGARLTQFVATYAVVLLPELLFLAWNEASVLNWHTVLTLYILGISRLTFYTVLQYLPRMTTDRYTGINFVSFFITLILLASVSLWVFIILESGLAVVLFYLLYYKYEPAAAIQD